MGNSNCCAYEGEDAANLALHQLGAAGVPDVPPQVYEGWRKRYSKGSAVDVLFPDGQGIECVLTLDSSKEILVLSFREKVRLIPYSDVESWIYGASAVDEGSPDAKLLRSPKVVGFRLSTSGRAIAVSFESAEHARCFVRFLDELVAKSKREKAPQPPRK